MLSKLKLYKSFLLAGVLLLQASHIPTASAQVNVFAENSLIIAATTGDAEFVRSQLLSNTDPNTTGDRGTTILIEAAKGGYSDIVDSAAEFGAFLDKGDDLGNSAIFYAIENYHYFIVEQLLGYGANPNKENRQKETPLIWAVRNGDPEILELLIEEGADPYKKDGTGRDIFDHIRQSRTPSLIEELEFLGYTPR